IGTAAVATAVSLPASRGSGPKILKFDVGGAGSSVGSGGGFAGADSEGSGFQVESPSVSGGSETKAATPSVGTLSAGLGKPSSSGSGKVESRRTSTAKGDGNQISTGPSGNVVSDEGLGISNQSSGGSVGGSNISTAPGAGRPSVPSVASRRLSPSAALPAAVVRYLKRFGKKLVSEFNAKRPDPELVNLLQDTRTRIEFAGKAYGRDESSARDVYILNPDNTLIQTKANGAVIGTEVRP
ncbi:MAG: hypothetical protein K2X47_01525, partial [Bdellovibrionales bacterium]|nr:hypothetical protein [Bdellovibrionales bacterium]